MRGVCTGGGKKTVFCTWFIPLMAERFAAPQASQHIQSFIQFGRPDFNICFFAKLSELGVAWLSQPNA